MIHILMVLFKVVPFNPIYLSKIFSIIQRVAGSIFFLGHLKSSSPNLTLLMIIENVSDGGVCSQERIYPSCNFTSNCGPACGKTFGGASKSTAHKQIPSSFLLFPMCEWHLTISAIFLIVLLILFNDLLWQYQLSISVVFCKCRYCNSRSNFIWSSMSAFPDCESKIHLAQHWMWF